MIREFPSANEPGPIKSPEDLRLESLRKEIVARKNFMVTKCHSGLKGRGNTDMAESLGNEALFLAFKNAAQFNGNSLDAWMATIARNTVINYMRHVKNEPAESFKKIGIEDEDIFDPDQNPEEKLIAEEEQKEKEMKTDALRKAMQKLSIPEGSVLEMDLQGLKGKEIAEKLAITPGNVRIILFRAQRKLAKIMGQSENLKIRRKE